MIAKIRPYNIYYPSGHISHTILEVSCITCKKVLARNLPLVDLEKITTLKKQHENVSPDCK